MKINRTLKSMFIMLGLACFATVAKADYTNSLVAQWNFSAGTAADLTSDVGAYTFTVAVGTPTYNAGTIFIPDGAELVAAGINSTALPALTTNATVWVKLKFDSVPVADPVFFFGLENATAPADWDQTSMVGMYANWGGANRIGQYAHTTTGAYGNTLAPPPATNTYFTMALVLTSGFGDGGEVDPTRTRFQTYINGVSVGSGSALGTVVDSLAFALGTLKAAGGVDITFDEARVYGQSLTASQIAQIGVPAVTSANGLVAQWNFSTGTAADLTSDVGAYAFTVAVGTPTYNAGSIFIPDGTELVATGINSTAMPALATNATVWVKMQFNSVPTPAQNPAFFFGLENATAPADWGQSAMTGMYADWGGANRIGQYANTTTGAYGNTLAPPPATNTSFTMALVLTSGLDENGFPDATRTRFQTYLNGVSIGSGSAAGTNVASLAFALGSLKASGGPNVTFDEARVYDKALTASQIAQIGVPAATNGLIAQWNFSTGTAADLTSDIGDFPFTLAGLGTPTYNVGSIFIPDGTELVAAGINSTDLPALATNATVWAKLKFDSVPVVNPVFFFGLQKSTTPADWDQVAMVGMQADWGAGNQIGQYANTVLGPPTGNYGLLFAATPATNTYFTMALVLTAGFDESGIPDATRTRFQTYFNGVSVGSGSAAGTNVISLAFALGTLKAAGGADYTFDEARVYDRALTAEQIAQIDLPHTPVFTSVVRSGSELVMSGTNGLPNGIYQLLSSTNVAMPVASWTPVSTNTLDAGGGFTVTNTIDPLKPAEFFLIKQ